MFSTGLEIPIYYMSKFKDYYFWDNQNESQIIRGEMTIDGGFTFGLNSISSVKFFPSKRFFLKTDLVFGAMYFNLGENLTINSINENTIDPSLSSQQEMQMECTYSTFQITKPELHFGIGFILNE